MVFRDWSWRSEIPGMVETRFAALCALCPCRTQLTGREGLGPDHRKGFCRKQWFLQNPYYFAQSNPISIFRITLYLVVVCPGLKFFDGRSRPLNHLVYGVVYQVIYQVIYVPGISVFFQLVYGRVMARFLWTVLLWPWFWAVFNPGFCGSYHGIMLDRLLLIVLRLIDWYTLIG